MSVAQVWDRFFWSMVLAILVGLVWLKFVDPVFPVIWVGVFLALAVGAVYFVTGILAMVRRQRREAELEKRAYAELLGQLNVEVNDD